MFTYIHRIHIHIADKFWVVQPSYFSQLRVVRQFPPRLTRSIMERSWLRPRMLTVGWNSRMLSWEVEHSVRQHQWKRLKISSRRLWNGPDLPGSSLPNHIDAERTVERYTQTAARKKQTCLVEAQANWFPKRTLPNLMVYFQAVQRSPGFQLSWSVTHVGVEFGDTTIFATFQISKWPLTYISVSHSNRAHWVTKMNCGSILSLVCCWVSVSGKKIFVLISPVRSSQNTPECRCWYKEVVSSTHHQLPTPGQTISRLLPVLMDIFIAVCACMPSTKQ